MTLLPEGTLKCYLLEHLLTPSSWLKTHTKHGWADHEALLLKARPLVAGTCYENRAMDQKVFIQILPEGEIKLLGCMILTKDKVLLENMIIFTSGDEIRLHVEEEDDTINTYYYYGEWKTKKRAPRKGADAYQLSVLETRTQNAAKINQSNDVLREIRARKAALEVQGVMTSNIEVVVED
jgi:hypothetical protein